MEMEQIVQLPSNQMLMIPGKNYIVNLIPVIIDDVLQYTAMINNINDIENMEMSIRVQNKERGLTAKTRFEDMIYEDEKMAVIIERAKKYAKSSATIMICGACLLYTSVPCPKPVVTWRPPLIPVNSCSCA